MPFLNLWIIKIQNEPIRVWHVAKNLITKFFKWHGGQSGATLSLKPHWPRYFSPQFPSLSQLLSILFSLTIGRSLQWPFDCLAVARTAHAPDSEERRLPTVKLLKSQLRTVGPTQPFESLASATIFGLSSAVRPPFLERGLRPLQNRAPMTDEPSPFKSQLLFTPCLLRLFSVNRGSFVRWDLQKFNVLFISFHLVYILTMFWRRSEKHVLRDRIVNLNAVSIYVQG